MLAAQRHAPVHHPGARAPLGQAAGERLAGTDAVAAAQVRAVGRGRRQRHRDQVVADGEAGGDAELQQLPVVMARAAPGQARLQQQPRRRLDVGEGFGGDARPKPVDTVWRESRRAAELRPEPRADLPGPGGLGAGEQRHEVPADAQVGRYEGAAGREVFQRRQEIVAARAAARRRWPAVGGRPAGPTRGLGRCVHQDEAAGRPASRRAGHEAGAKQGEGGSRGAAQGDGAARGRARDGAAHERGKRVAGF